jgi:hypothetical protein
MGYEVDSNRVVEGFGELVVAVTGEDAGFAYARVTDDQQL